MKLLLDENTPESLARLLRDLGHDVVLGKEALRGSGDAAVLARAQAEGRLLVTQDKDFGELAFRFGLPSECGVILFRLGGVSPEADTQRMFDVIASRTDWAGHFVVATEDRVRMRPLPPK